MRDDLGGALSRDNGGKVDTSQFAACAAWTLPVQTRAAKVCTSRSRNGEAGSGAQELTFRLSSGTTPGYGRHVESLGRARDGAIPPFRYLACQMIVPVRIPVLQRAHLHRVR